MRRSFGVFLAGALSASWLPALAEPAAIRTCGHDVMENCAALSDANGGPIQGIATDACTSFNATMTQFCEMLGDHEPDSPEMLAATAKVIAAKRHLLKQLKKPNGERS